MVIDDGRIAEVLEGHDCTPELPADEVFDATGCYVLPGIIDDHVHFRDPGLTRKADFDTESKAAGVIVRLMLTSLPLFPVFFFWKYFRYLEHNQEFHCKA